MQWNEYVHYFKDNPKGYWFKRKLYGWGWTPVTKEGWFVTLLSIGAIVFLAFRVDEAAGGREVFMELIAPTLGIIFLLVVVCFKTGEPPKWTWGIPGKFSENKEDEADEQK